MTNGRKKLFLSGLLTVGLISIALYPLSSKAETPNTVTNIEKVDFLEQ